MRAIPLVLGWIVVCVGGRAAAESASPLESPRVRAALVAEAQRLLATNDPRLAAWGAWIASEHGLTEAWPGVVRWLGRHANAPETPESPYLTAVLLDAVLNLDPVVEPRDLLPFRDGPTGNAVYVYLVRHLDRCREACFELFEGEEYDRSWWLALGNAMSRADVPGFAGALLRGLALHLTIRVRQGPGPSSASGRVSGSLRSQPAPVGYPPFPVTTLRETPAYGSRLFAPGPRNVYLLRRVCRDLDDAPTWLEEREPGRDVHTARAAWLAAFEGIPEVPPVYSEVELWWTGPRGYLRGAVQARAALCDAWTRIVDVLHAQGRLTDAERLALPPRVLVNIEDERSRPRRDLPPLPPLPSAVRR